MIVFHSNGSFLTFYLAAWVTLFRVHVPYAQLYPTNASVHMQEDSTRVTQASRSTIEGLPILSYDTDVGPGYGVKLFFLNQLKRNESFDILLFNSTKGERWYRLVFSLPDFERRQGKVYPVALDLTVEYDKWIKNSFFGIGNTASFQDREFYTREPIEVSAAVSRGFSPYLVGQVGVRYKIVRNFNFSETSRLVRLPPSLNASRVSYGSLFLTFRYDTRDSYINPSRGMVIGSEIEFAPEFGPGNVDFTRFGTTIQHYSSVLHPRIILATRLSLQTLANGDLPVQVLLPVGGGSTLRGSPQDRYLDRISAVANAELRFPIIWRFGGVAGLDFGKVWNRMNEIDLDRWAVNPVAGLRFYMNMFLVRVDVGFGKETTGLYFNFGHVF